MSLTISISRMAEVEAARLPQERARFDAIADTATARMSALITELVQR